MELHFLGAGYTRNTLHLTTEPPVGWLTGVRCGVKGVRIGNKTVL